MRAALLLLLAQRASAQCVLPSTLADYGPVLSAFSGSGLSLAPARAAQVTTAGQGGSAMLAFTHPTRTNAYAIECGMSLDVNFVTSLAAMVSSGPGVGATSARCTLLSVGSSEAKLTTSLAANCTAPATQASFDSTYTAASQSGFAATLQLGSASQSFPALCDGLSNPPSAASQAVMSSVALLGSAAGLTVNITNTTLLMPEPASAFAPLGNDAPYSILTCVQSARVLEDGLTVEVKAYDDKCAYLLPAYAAGFISATTTWQACSSAAKKFSDVAAANATARFAGTFAYPPPASRGAALPPPPPPARTKLETVPVVTFSTTLAFPDLQNLSPTEAAAKVLTPCSVAALRSAYSASLGVPLHSILLERITLSDGSFMELSPSSSGNAAAGACAAGAARLLLRGGQGAAEEALSEDTARALAALLPGVGGGAARALQAPAAGSIAVQTKVVKPPAAVQASLTAASPAALTLNVPALGGSVQGTPSGATAGSATLAVVQEPPARINPYKPSALITSWNAIPRGASSNVFTTSNLDMDSVIACAQGLGAKDKCKNEYIFGALAPGLALIICGVVFLIVWLLAYCFACVRCCGCFKPRDRSATGKFAFRATWLPRVRLLLGIINFGLIFGAVGYMPLFPKGLTGLGATADSLVNTLQDVAQLLGNNVASDTVSVRLFGGGATEPLTPPLAAISAAGSSLTALSAQTSTSPYTQCPAVPAPSSQCSSSFVINLLSGTSSALSTAGGADLGSASSAVSAAVGTVKSSLGSLNLSGVAGSITGAALPLFAIIAIMCVLQAVWVCRCWLACCMFKALAPISIIWNFVLFLLAGIFYIVATLGSDVCVNPTATILTAVGNNPQLAYYLTCATNPSLPPPDFLSFVAAAVGKLQSGSTQVTKLVTLANSAAGATAGYGPLVASGAAAPALTDAAGSLAAAVASISAIPDKVFACVQVDALFNGLFDSLCNGTVSAAAGIAQCLVAAAVLMLLQMVMGVDQCCYHAGDAKAWVDGGADDAGKNCCGYKGSLIKPVGPAAQAAAHASKVASSSGAPQV